MKAIAITSAVSAPTPSFWRRPESRLLSFGAQHRKLALRAGYDLDSSLRWNDEGEGRALLALEATG
jgi:hypothetical protein